MCQIGNKQARNRHFHIGKKKPGTFAGLTNE